MKQAGSVWARKLIRLSPDERFKILFSERTVVPAKDINAAADRALQRKRGGQSPAFPRKSALGQLAGRSRRAKRGVRT